MPQFTMSSPIGLLTLVEAHGALIALIFGGDKETPATTPLLQEAQHQLSAYFSGKRQTFDLPLAPKGTPFQQTVWQALRQIPYGQTCTYGEIAASIGKPKACRAVGMANHRNPLPILIPCHRVIGGNGDLTGYAGGLAIKQFLLHLEHKK